jgi:primosomal protein N'
MNLKIGDNVLVDFGSEGKMVGAIIDGDEKNGVPVTIIAIKNIHGTEENKWCYDHQIIQKVEDSE